MYIDEKILMGKGDYYVYILPEMINRHGLIAGATGTGKTITLKVMAESLSDMGVPVFLADIKGDISGTCLAGTANEKTQERLTKLGINEFKLHAYPVEFWDVFGKHGHPVRTTISEMGPMLLARLMGLTDVQSGVLNIVFRIADDQKLLLLDLKDLRAMLQYVGNHNKELTTTYGNVSKQSVGAVLRALLSLEDEGGNSFFGEPALDIKDWFNHDENGHGVVNILHCVELYRHPLLYSTFMLWLLNELFEVLPEVGDLPKPKMAFFFDEAHLLFNDAPDVLVDKIIQVVKLIRSKGVGVYFITQNPSDLPDGVLAQLGNRVQHALRGYTLSEQKSIRAAAASFRPNPAFKTEQVISEMGTGEALTSFLDTNGVPAVVQKVKIVPPMSSMGPADDVIRVQVIKSSRFYGKYETAVDRESAFEILGAQTEQIKVAEQEAAVAAAEAKRLKEEAKADAAAQRAARRQPKSFTDKMLDRTIDSFERKAINAFTRGILGLLKK